MLCCEYNTFCQIISKNVFKVGRKYSPRASNHILWTDEDYFCQKSEEKENNNNNNNNKNIVGF